MGGETAQIFGSARARGSTPFQGWNSINPLTGDLRFDLLLLTTHRVTKYGAFTFRTLGAEGLEF